MLNLLSFFHTYPYIILSLLDFGEFNLESFVAEDQDGGDPHWDMNEAQEDPCFGGATFDEEDETGESCSWSGFCSPCGASMDMNMGFNATLSCKLMFKTIF